MTLRLRGSALPLAFLCPGSLRPGELAIDERNEGGALGSACHEGLAGLVATGRVDWEGVAALARRHQCDEDELRMLLGIGAKQWATLRPSFPDAIAEFHISIDLPGEVVLSGHLDVYGRQHTRAHVLDWKTGRVDHDYSEQLRAYCALVLLEDDSIDEVTAGIVWLRENEYEHYTMTRAELPAYLRRLRAEVVDWDGTFHPSASSCRHCPRSHDCPARHALVRRDVAAFLGGELTGYAVDENALARLPAAQVHALLASADLVRGICESLRSAIHELVERKGDIVADGQRLTIQRTEKRRLKVIQAWPVLEAFEFENPDIERSMELHVGEAEKIVKEKAPYRQGAASIRKFKAALEAAGAVEKTPVSKLITRRDPQ